jgi:DNA-binding PucR family transcriptional regulator
MDGALYADISLFARPAELTASDRIAQLAAAAAIGNAYAYPTRDTVERVVKGRCFAVALRATEANPADLVEPTRQQFSRADVALAVGSGDDQVCLAVGSVDRPDWSWRLTDWQASLSDELGPVSIGYALRMGAHLDQFRSVRAQATEALLVGDRLFAAGHLTSYPDAHLAAFLLDSQGASLRALYEEVVGKLSPQDDARLHRDLIRTVQVYCEEVSTQRTAERLQVHRNTVLYRLKQIEEITSFDLEDPTTRLLLRIGLFAGQLVRQTRSRVAAERSYGLRRHLDLGETISA